MEQEETTRKHQNCAVTVPGKSSEPKTQGDVRRTVSDSCGESEKNKDQICNRSFVPDAGRTGAKHDQPDQIENHKAFRSPGLPEEIRKGGIKPREVLFAKMDDEQADTQDVRPYEPLSCRLPSGCLPNDVRDDETQAQTGRSESQQKTVEGYTCSDYRDPDQSMVYGGLFQVSEWVNDIMRV
jgi:hypothetical protein